MLRETLSPGAAGEGRPPRRRREAAAAISPRQGQTPTRTHRPLAPSGREHATSRQKKAEKRSVVPFRHPALAVCRLLWRARPRGDERKAPAMGHLLLHAQAWWDAQRFDQPVWQVAAWREQKLRHIQLHVAKALGKVVVAYGEEGGGASRTDALARVRDEVLPDVAIYRSQLINLFPEVGAPPPSLAHRKAGVGTPEDEPLRRVVLGLSQASAQLAAYLEPRGHGAASPLSPIH